MGRKRKIIWNSIHLCIFWTIWKEQNRIAFKKRKLVVHRLKYSFVYNLWSWNRSYLREKVFSLTSFLEWLASN